MEATIAAAEAEAAELVATRAAERHVAEAADVLEEAGLVREEEEEARQPRPARPRRPPDPSLGGRRESAAEKRQRLDFHRVRMADYRAQSKTNFEFDISA